MATTTVEPALFVDCSTEEFDWVKKFFDLEGDVMPLHTHDFWEITEFTMQDEGKTARDLVTAVNKALNDSLKPIAEIIFY